MFRRLIASLVCLTFIFSNLQQSYAQDFSINQLPVPGTMVGESVPFAPLALKGLVVNPQKPLEFQFIVDTGKGPQDTATIKDQANQLVKYFLAGLTIPEGDLWVNLSPYEKNRMVPAALGQTDLGRDLLAQDYILKQLTASLIYPEKDLGKEFWNRVYAKAQAQFGTTNVPVNTFNKVWILPDQAQVFENVNAAYVTKSTLKVMLDEDYLAKKKHMAIGNATGSIGSQIVRQIILPEIEKEVNTGKNFAPLRQIYQALILAKWYKETIQNGLLDAVYTNKNKVAGVNLNDPTVKEQIYERYLKAYKKGAFNYIKESPTPDGQVMPRKYFSGGTKFFDYKLDITRSSKAMLTLKQWAGALFLLTVALGSSALAQNNIPPQTRTTQTQSATIPYNDPENEFSSYDDSEKYVLFYNQNLLKNHTKISEQDFQHLLNEAGGEDAFTRQGEPSLKVRNSAVAVLRQADRERAIKYFFYHLEEFANGQTSSDIGYLDEALEQLGADRERLFQINIRLLNIHYTNEIEAINFLGHLGDYRAIEPIRGDLDDFPEGRELGTVATKTDVRDILRHLGASWWQMQSDSYRQEIEISGVILGVGIGLAGLLAAWKKLRGDTAMSTLEAQNKNAAMFSIVQFRLKWILKHNTGEELKIKLKAFLESIKGQQILKAIEERLPRTVARIEKVGSAVYSESNESLVYYNSEGEEITSSPAVGYYSDGLMWGNPPSWRVGDVIKEDAAMLESEITQRETDQDLSIFTQQSLRTIEIYRSAGLTPLLMPISPITSDTVEIDKSVEEFKDHAMLTVGMTPAEIQTSAAILNQILQFASEKPYWASIALGSSIGILSRINMKANMKISFFGGVVAILPFLGIFPVPFTFILATNGNPNTPWSDILPFFAIPFLFGGSTFLSASLFTKWWKLREKYGNSVEGMETAEINRLYDELFKKNRSDAAMNIPFTKAWHAEREKKRSFEAFIDIQLPGWPRSYLPAQIYKLAWRYYKDDIKFRINFVELPHPDHPPGYSMEFGTDWTTDGLNRAGYFSFSIEIADHAMFTPPKQKQDAAMFAIPGTTQWYVNRLKNGNSDVRESAVKVLQMKRWQPKTVDDQIFYYEALNQWDKLAEMGKASTPFLLSIINKPWISTGKRINAAFALIKIGDMRGMDFILNHNEHLIGMALDRKESIEALRKIGQPAISLLLEALKTKNERTVEFSARLLKKMGVTPQTREDKIIYYAALGEWHELVKIGAFAVPTLIRAKRWEELRKIGTAVALRAVAEHEANIARQQAEEARKNQIRSALLVEEKRRAEVVSKWPDGSPWEIRHYEGEKYVFHPAVEGHYEEVIAPYGSDPYVRQDVWTSAHGGYWEKEQRSDDAMSTQTQNEEEGERLIWDPYVHSDGSPAYNGEHTTGAFVKVKEAHGTPEYQAWWGENEKLKKSTQDKASLANGGIDLNQIAIKRTGHVIKMQFDQAQLQALEQGGFAGFTPVITGFEYISSPFPLLGINTPKATMQLAKA